MFVKQPPGFEGQKQWIIQARNEATSRRNTKDDETNDGEVPKTSSTLVAQP